MRARHRRFISGLLAGGMLVLLVTGIGVGHRVSEAVALNRHLFFVAENELIRVDGDTGQLDGRQPVTPGGDVEVTQPPQDSTGPGYLTSGAAVLPFDPRSMEVGEPQTFSEGVQAVSGNRLTYLLEPASGQVTTYDSHSGTDESSSPSPGASAPAPAAAAGPTAQVGEWLDEPVVDSADGLWLLTEGGTALSRVVGGSVRTIQLPDGSAASRLTLVGDRPVVLAGNQLLRLRDDDPTWDSQPVEGSGGAPATLAAPTRSGTVVWFVEQPAGQPPSLSGVDLDTGARRTGPVDAPAGGAGQPIVAGQSVYVPVNDQESGYAVHRYDGATGRADGVSRVDVPWDPARTLQLTARSGQVWAHVPGGTTAVLFEPDQADRTVQLDPDGPADLTRPATPSPTPASPPPTSPPPSPPTPPPASPLPPSQRPAPHTDTPPTRPAAPQDAAPSPTSLPTATVPNIIGQDRLAGCRVLEQASFSCSWRAQAGQGTPGRVASTDPAGGSRVARGSVITISYLTVGMPDLRGRPHQGACDALGGQADCRVEAALEPAPTYSAGGLVSAQNVPVGEDLLPGTSVVLTYYDKVTVPDLAGQDGAASCSAVTGFLACVQVTSGLGSSAAPPGTVTSQDPAAGTVVPVSAALSLTVAGAQPVVPDVSATLPTPDAACAVVQQANLTCVPQLSPYLTPNVVFQQSPAAGTAADPGAAVTVYYWPVGPQPIVRYRQTDGDRVWVLRGNGVPPPLSRYEEKGQTGSSARGDGDPAVAAFLNPMVDFQCPTCAYQINHYMTTNGAPPSGAGWESLGTVGWVFKEQYRPEMVPLHRMFLKEGNGRSWAYAVYGREAWQSYAALGYVDDGILGYVWPS